MKNYYQTLGLKGDATDAEIKKAYRVYATKFHPDKQNGDKFFEERFKEVLEAYEVLSNDRSRADYDAKWRKFSSNASSHFHSGNRYNPNEDLKNERDISERKEKEERERAEHQHREAERESAKLREEELLKIRKSRIFFTSKNLSVNGMYIYKSGSTFMIDEYDKALIRKDDNSSFVFLGIVLIIAGILTIGFFIGVILIAWGIFALFYKEYFVVLVNEDGDIPVIKGRKQKMRRIAKRINQAKQFKPAG